MKHAKGGFLTIALFAVAATLLIFSVAGSSQAALQYFSETYGAQVSMQDIGVTLLENDVDSSENYENVSWRNYVENPDSNNEESNWSEHTGELVQQIPEQTESTLKLGHSYDERLAVRNSGTIDEYVRVTIYRYWADGSGRKVSSLNSDLIKLDLTLGNGWREDESARTEERTVLYYDPILGSGETTPAFSSKLEIDDEGVEKEVLKREVSTDAAGNKTIETYYTYNGHQFVLEVNVDAVQTHNANAAKMSAWGTLG